MTPILPSNIVKFASTVAVVHLLQECTGISVNALKAPTARANELQSENIQRIILLQVMGEQIVTLCDQLWILIKE